MSACAHLEDILSSNLDALFRLPDEQAAPALDERMQAWNRVDALHERSYGERGVIALEVERRGLWRHLGFNSFTAWVAANGRRTTFEAKRDAEDLRDIPSDEIIQIPKSNLKVLKQLSTQVRRQPQVLESAKSMDSEAFLEHLSDVYPSQHIESHKFLRFHPERSQAEVIERSIRLAMELDGYPTREAVLEAWAAAYELEHPMVEA